MNKNIENNRKEFNEILSLIDSARDRAFKAVNKELISLYWKLGEYVSKKLEHEGWATKPLIILWNTLKR